MVRYWGIKGRRQKAGDGKKGKLRYISVYVYRMRCIVEWLLNGIGMVLKDGYEKAFGGLACFAVVAGFAMDSSGRLRSAVIGLPVGAHDYAAGEERRRRRCHLAVP